MRPGIESFMWAEAARVGGFWRSERSRSALSMSQYICVQVHRLGMRIMQDARPLT